MKGQTHGGKGSAPRPTNKRRFDENYENIFGKKTPEERVELDEGVHTAESDGRQRESKLREHVEGAGIQGQADQEQAVAWMYEKPVKDGFSELTLSFGYEPEFDGIIRPLFVESNPKRQPLSNDEIAELWGWKESGNTETVRDFARAIEKAHGIGE